MPAASSWPPPLAVDVAGRDGAPPRAPTLRADDTRARTASSPAPLDDTGEQQGARGKGQRQGRRIVGTFRHPGGHPVGAEHGHGRTGQYELDGDGGRQPGHECGNGQPQLPVGVQPGRQRPEQSRPGGGGEADRRMPEPEQHPADPEQVCRARGEATGPGARSPGLQPLAQRGQHARPQVGGSPRVSLPRAATPVADGGAPYARPFPTPALLGDPVGPAPAPDRGRPSGGGAWPAVGLTCLPCRAGRSARGAARRRAGRPLRPSPATGRRTQRRGVGGARR